MLGGLQGIVKQAVNMINNAPGNSKKGGLSCYRHQSNQAVATCSKCGKAICNVCLEHSKALHDSVSSPICPECLLASGVVKCGDHPSQQAVALCARCGKGICKDCNEMYGVEIGEYAGQSLCYDCTSHLVAKNVTNIEAFKKQVKKEHIWMIVGAVIGLLIVGPIIVACTGYVWVSEILAVFVCASFGTIFNFIIDLNSTNSSDEGTFIKLIIALGSIVFSPVITIYRFVNRIKQIKKCDEIIASDSRVLQYMKDYFAYTQAIENNKGVDLAKLTEQGGELFDNTYAQYILNKGEKEAQAELRQSVVTISENGEIIRNFDNNPKKKTA